MNTNGYYPLGIKIPKTRLTPQKRVIIKGRMFLECLCSCGNKTFALAADIKWCRKKSCGCLRNELSAARNRTHGLSGSAEYWAAHNAWRRCNIKSEKYYPDYGGRGIRFEFKNSEHMTRWLLAHLPRPKKGLVLDRINNEGHYAKGNLKWSTRRESALNTRVTRMATIGGITKPLLLWAESAGLSPMTVYTRIKRKFPEELWLHKGKITKAQIFEYLDKQL